MEDLIAEIQEKTGLSTEKVLEVVTLVTEFMKERLPDDLVQSISGYLGGAAEKAMGAAGSATGVGVGAAKSATSVAAGATGKAVGSAASAFSKAVDAVGDAANSNNDE